MRANLGFGFKGPRYSLILNLLLAHFKEFFYKANNQLMFFVQVSYFSKRFFNFLTRTAMPKIDSKSSLDGQIENLSYLPNFEYLFSIDLNKQIRKKMSHIYTVVSTDMRQLSTLMGHSSTILAHHCLITVPHTIYKKLLKQNKLSLESLGKNILEIIKKIVLKKCVCKKTLMSHDNQIEFIRKIDRSTQEYDFKIPMNNQISMAQEAKIVSSLSWISLLKSTIKKLAQNPNEKSCDFFSNFNNFYCVFFYQRKWGIRIVNKQVLKTSSVVRLEAVESKLILTSDRLTTIQTFFCNLQINWGRSNLSLQ